MNALKLDPAFGTKESSAYNIATSDDYSKPPTFFQQDVLEEMTSTTSTEGTRYLIKYRKTSSQYQANRKLQAQAKKQGGKFLTCDPSIWADTHLLTHGRFLPNQNIEIVYLSEAEKTRFEQRDDVEYIGKGKCRSLHFLFICIQSVSFY